MVVVVVAAVVQVSSLCEKKGPLCIAPQTPQVGSISTSWRPLFVSASVHFYPSNERSAASEMCTCMASPTWLV